MPGTVAVVDDGDGNAEVDDDEEFEAAEAEAAAAAAAAIIAAKLADCCPFDEWCAANKAW